MSLYSLLFGSAKQGLTDRMDINKNYKANREPDDVDDNIKKSSRDQKKTGKFARSVLFDFSSLRSNVLSIYIYFLSGCSRETGGKERGLAG
jgi:hypothetical protein